MDSSQTMEPSPELVGNHFIKMYYGVVLPKDPLELYRFYSEQSALCHAAGNEPEKYVTGLDNIKSKLRSLNLADATVDLDCGSVDAQPSHNGSIVMMVTGSIRLKKEPPKQFAQTFLLSLQKKNEKHHFFVLNDIFRLLDTIPPVLEAAVEEKLKGKTEIQKLPSLPQSNLPASPNPEKTPQETQSSLPSLPHKTPSSPQKALSKDIVIPPVAPQEVLPDVPQKVISVPLTPPQDEISVATMVPPKELIVPPTTPSSPPSEEKVGKDGWSFAPKKANESWNGGEEQVPQTAPEPLKKVVAKLKAEYNASTQKRSSHVNASHGKNGQKSSQVKSWAAVVTKGSTEDKNHINEAPSEEPRDGGNVRNEDQNGSSFSQKGQSEDEVIDSIPVSGRKNIEKETSVLFVRNIDFKATTAQISEVFEPFGQVLEVKSHADRGFAFVHYASSESISNVMQTQKENKELILLNRPLKFHVKRDFPRGNFRGRGGRWNQRPGRGFGGRHIGYSRGNQGFNRVRGETNKDNTENKAEPSGPATSTKEESV